MLQIPGGLSLAWEGPLAGVWRRIDRKFRRRPRDRKDLFSSVVCALSVSCDCAEVNRLEVPFSTGSRRCRGFAVPVRLCLPVWAWSGPAHRASSVAVPSVAHVCERLGSMRRDHSLTHQRPLGIFDIKTRTFHLINTQILRAHPYQNPSRPVRPSLAPRGKLVYQSGDWRRTVPGTARAACLDGAARI
jgi:hypothetical protein